MRARQWAKSFLIGIVCGGTSLGILLLGVLAYFKYKISREKDNKIAPKSMKKTKSSKLELK